MQQAKPLTASFIRITNIAMPDGKFAISGLRVFGIGEGKTPDKVTGLKATRLADKKVVNLIWESVDKAVGYTISFGTKPDKLYLNYMVYRAYIQAIRNLNAILGYYFRIESFNENGISEKSEVDYTE
jgi:xylan 1,4-beta-xylosidase